MGKSTLSCGQKRLLKLAEILSNSAWRVITMVPFSTGLSRVRIIVHFRLLSIGLLNFKLFKGAQSVTEILPYTVSWL